MQTGRLNRGENAIREWVLGEHSDLTRVPSNKCVEGCVHPGND